MGVRVLEGIRINDTGHDGVEYKGAVMYCSVSNVAFGPVFRDGDQAERFIALLSHVDPRQFDVLELASQASVFFAMKGEAEHDPAD